MKLILALLLMCIGVSAESKTWRVNLAGTGDAPSLHAAMDSAVAFDVVLVEAGHYVLSSRLRVPPDVQLVGESGPAYTVISRDAFAELGTIYLAGSSMYGIYVRGNTSPVLLADHAQAEYSIIEALPGVGVVNGSGSLVFRHCLLIGEGEMFVPAEFLACIIMADLGPGAVGSTVLACNLLGDVHPGIDVSGVNFSLDPQFCGIPGSGNYFLQSTSPCLPENNPYGASIAVGPLPQGCGSVTTEERTWGGVKALYR